MRGINHEPDEIKKELINKNLDMAILSGTMKKLGAAVGVTIMISKRGKNKLCSYIYINERTVMRRLWIDRGYISIASTYAPEERQNEDTAGILQNSTRYITKSE